MKTWEQRRKERQEIKQKRAEMKMNRHDTFFYVLGDIAWLFVDVLASALSFVVRAFVKVLD